MTDLIVDPEYRFSTEVADPNGLRVQVAVTAPAMTVDARLVADLAELTQAGASRTMNSITQAIRDHRERCPF